MEIVKNEMLKSLILLDTKRTFFDVASIIHYLTMAPFDPTLWWQLGECLEFRYRIAELLWLSRSAVTFCPFLLALTEHFGCSQRGDIFWSTFLAEEFLKNRIARSSCDADAV